MISKTTNTGSESETQNSDNGIEQPKPLKIPDALLLGSIPLLAYGLLYSYESGLFGYFGIPIRFINFDVSELLIFTAAFSFVGYFVFVFFNIVYQIASTLQSESARIRVISFMSLILFLAIDGFLFLRIDNLSSAIFVFVLGFFILLWVFFAPILFTRTPRKYSEKFESYHMQPIHDTSITRTLIDELVSLIGGKGILIILLYVGACFTMYIYGEVKAYEKTNFHVVKTTPECVVIYENPERLLCKTIDKSKKEFQKGYVVYYLQDIKGINIDEEEIGPLRLKPTPTITPTPTPVPTKTLMATSTP